MDVVKEVTLRMRGAKEVEKLLKEPRKKALKKPTPRRMLKDVNTTTSAVSSDTNNRLVDDDDDISAEELDDPRDDLQDEERGIFDITKDYARLSMRDGLYDKQDEWLFIDDSDDDLRSVTSTLRASPDKDERTGRMAMDPIFGDSDWHDVPVLD